MSPKIRIEAAKSSDGAPAPREIAEVKVGDSDCVWPKIEGAGCKDRSNEVPDQGWLGLGEDGHLRLNECCKERSKCPKKY
jgi:hypothetical protein